MEQTEKCYLVKTQNDNVFKYAKKKIEKGQSNAFYVMSLKSVRQRVAMWKQLLPNVKMHYAVKTNCNEAIVKQVVDLG